MAEVNGSYVKVAKFLGEFVWHQHDEEDELFWVIRGSIQIALRDGVIQLEAGDMSVVPKGVEHCPSAANEAWVVLLEPKATKHTGDAKTDRTVDDQDWL